MKISLFEKDPRQNDLDFKDNMGPFSVLNFYANRYLKKQGYWANYDDCDWVGIADGLDVGFKYKNKKSFLWSVWELNCLPLQFLQIQKQTNQKIIGISNQITKLWQSYNIPAQTAHLGCNTSFWKPTKPKFDIFTFIQANSSTVRSGFELAVQAYLNAFGAGKKTKLLIKDTNNSLILKQKLDDLIKSGCNIEYISKRITYKEMRDLYSQCHVSLSVLRHASGGMINMEAAACRCYPVTGDIEPTNEYIKPEYGSLLKPFRMIEINKAIPILESNFGLINHYPKLTYLEEPMFYDFNSDSYSDLLVNIYENWEKKYSKIDTRTPIVENWQWSNRIKRLYEVVST